jgi:hypothetical protein
VEKSCLTRQQLDRIDRDMSELRELTYRQVELVEKGKLKGQIVERSLKLLGVVERPYGELSNASTKDKSLRSLAKANRLASPASARNHVCDASVQRKIKGGKQDRIAECDKHQLVIHGLLPENLIRSARPLTFIPLRN